ncbi:unnamed protein product [Mycena citricolor]|uniref:Uncharacterized protein n=1 Tax=Mycena citricolor TaxID=2018698 RepID=A0AAD2Q7A9_9AGAR|nr:unnamed protein product [Mycena citricolor]
MRTTVKTPPRRKSVINLFTTPPLRRSDRSTRPTDDYDLDDDEDEDVFIGTGDLSLSHPYFVPGGPGALTPKRPLPPSTVPGKTKLRVVRPMPPARRASTHCETYKFRTLTLKGGPMTPRTTTTTTTQTGSIGTIPDEVLPCTTREQRLAAAQARLNVFMGSRDLTRSPQKASSSGSSSEVDCRRNLLEDLNREAQGVVGQAKVVPVQPKHATRPLRGNARLPARPRIPDFDGMDVDI